MNSFHKLIQKVVLVIVLAVQLFYVSGASFAQAQGLTNPIDTTKPAAELPTYQGVDGSIKDYLCTPQGTGTDLYDCIGRLYKFGISFGAIALVFFLVIAGYIYLSGGEAAKGKAKNMLYSAFTGMAILLGSYLLLSFINPELVKIKTIQPPIFEALDLPKCEDIGFSTKCIISTGPGTGQVYTAPGGASGCANRESGSCTKQVISACPGMAANMENALRACNQESMGGKAGIASTVDRCDSPSGVVAFSWGLWQINVAAGSYGDEFPECKGVLREAGGPWKTLCITGGTCGRKCEFGSGGKAAFDKCTAALADPVRNTKQACKLFNDRGWKPWPHTRKVCKLP